MIGSLSLMVFVLFNLEDLRHRWMISRTRPVTELSASIPFEMLRGLILLDASVEGSNFRMIVDSGAFETRISADSAARADIAAVISDDVGDTYGRSAEMGIATLESFAIGDARWTKATAGLLQWGDDALTPCVAPDGIIGGTLMRHASWVIDYRSNFIHIGDADRMPDAAFTASDISVWSSIPMKLEAPSLSPTISAQINGREVNGLLLDTGSNGALTLPRDLLEALVEPGTPLLHVSDESTAGIFGTASVSAVKAPVQFAIGDGAVRTVWASFTDDSAAKIGNQLLQTYGVGIVPGEKRLYLRDDWSPDFLLPGAGTPEGVIDAPLRHGFIPGIKDGQWEVVYRERMVDALGGFADQNGEADPLAVGTKIITINGNLPADLFENRCQWFLGIREVIDADTLFLEMPDGSVVILGE